MTGKTICVAGASGLVGANITRAALARGYAVNGTMRDTVAPDKVPYLQALEGSEMLSLFQADMAAEDGWDDALTGADAVFIACLIPTYKGPTGKPAKEMEDEQGYAEIIMPTVNGCLNIMRAAGRQGVKNIIICSSTSSTNPIPPVAKKNEVDHWSDADQQCRDKKYTSATKTVMEKAAMDLAARQDQRLVIMLPTLMLGPMVMPGHAQAGFMGQLAKLVRGETGRHQAVPNDSSSMAHIHDVAALFLAAYENPAASGRYFGVYDSWHWNDIYGVLKGLVPASGLPAPFEGEKAAPTGFDFKRRDSLGVNMRDIPTLLRDAVDWIKSDPFA
ncbi:MAG: NAD-dependent epimerase/dehydratase family protein [Pseudomonadota bacterium]